MDTVYLDVETTGLDAGYDEIVQIGIIDDDANTLVSSLVRPIARTAWPDAEYLHGIRPTDVADAPTLDELRDAIIEAVKGKRVVVYNLAFDSKFLRPELRHAGFQECAMRDFAEVYGDFSEYHGNYRWQSLSTAADYVRFEWPSAAHDAIADCLATRAVWRYMNDASEQARVEQAREEQQRDYMARLAYWRLFSWVAGQRPNLKQQASQ